MYDGWFFGFGRAVIQPGRESRDPLMQENQKLWLLQPRPCGDIFVFAEKGIVFIGRMRYDIGTVNERKWGA